MHQGGGKEQVHMLDGMHQGGGKDQVHPQTPLDAFVTDKSHRVWASAITADHVDVQKAAVHA